MAAINIHYNEEGVAVNHGESREIPVSIVL